MNDEKMNAQFIPTICFDCDSTLSGIEIIDELARLRGEDAFRRIKEMTAEAMEGAVSVEDIFSKRLEMIRPTRAEVEKIGELCLANREKTALETVCALQKVGWQTIIVSGGFRLAIAPLAKFLGIARIQAVDLFFDEAGNYAGFDRDSPTARSFGKNEVIRKLRAENAGPIVMVGDGASDIETQPEVDLFIGFGGFVERAKVKSDAPHFVHALREILPLVEPLASLSR